MQNINDTYVDVTVVRAGSKSHKNSAASVTGGAANKAERGKLLNTPYAAMAKKDGRDFLPMHGSRIFRGIRKRFLQNVVKYQ